MAKRGNSVFGIDLGKHIFKGVLLQRKGADRFVLTSYASREVPEELNTPDELAQQLKLLLKDLGGSANGCAIGVSDPESLLRAADIALDKRDTAIDFRLAGMNEWRGAMTDLTGTFVTRLQQDANDSRLKLLENFRANIQGRMAAIAGGSVLLNIVITVVAVVLAQGR
jgi:hypothetical protein